jgi:hypothetical protein
MIYKLLLMYKVLYALLDYQGSGLSGYPRTNLELQSGYFFFTFCCLLSIAGFYLVRQSNVRQTCLIP